MNIVHLRERLAARFPDVEQIEGSVIRFTKRIGNVPYAVYYLDIAEELPQSQEMLMKYQDRVIGSHFFEGRKSLQWSNYLYFVTSRDRSNSAEVRKSKEIIERDRSYARKFVILEEDIDSVLTPSVVVPAQTAQHANILTVWSERLVTAGLDNAILCDSDLPTRLKLIEDSATVLPAKQKLPKQTVKAICEPFIRSLKLETFRRYPLERSYNFGTVNLIFGANGSGKTSLLEAIELLYCGKSKRNPDLTQHYKFETVYADGRTETVTSNRELQIFRNRNLMWYGQPEVRTNNLYQSFAQFNFLDTDAAVDLADSDTRIEEDLSKLLIGPEASKVWRDIERVDDDVVKKLSSLRQLASTMKDELALLEKRLSEASAIPHESDSIRKRMEDMIQRVGWLSGQGGIENSTTKLVESLPELLSLVQQATEINWAGSPVSMVHLATYCREAKITSEKAGTGITRLEALQREQKYLVDVINACGEAKNLANQAIGFIDSGLLIRMSEHDKLQSSDASYSARIGGFDSVALDKISVTDRRTRVDSFRQIAMKKRVAAESSLSEAQKEYANFSKLRDESLNLAQQLREVAAKITQISEQPDECPLCHTQFKQGELVKHINVGVDDHLESLGQTFLTQLTHREAILKDARSVETVASWLEKFCERANLAGEIAIEAVLAEVEKTRRSRLDTQSRLDDLRNEVLVLESQGFTISRLESILARLGELGYPLTTYSGESAHKVDSTIDRMMKNSSQALETLRREADELQQSLRLILDPPEAKGHDLRAALSLLKERIAATEILRTKLDQFSSDFPWTDGKPLSELFVEAESIRKVAAGLQAAIAREKQAEVSQVELYNRKKQLDQKLSGMNPKIDRLAKAHSTFNGLQVDHSLSSAMEAALQENRHGIESIFSQIHSPAEFSGLSKSCTTLIRKLDGQEAKLTQISTGQRAAFALSIFLAQNAQLKFAPPVILIDDPIAHVDDMNSLSFLDYLREVAMKNQRQIFFATANEKLATLFERKFDFLGAEEFRRFNLSREVVQTLRAD
jgi:exonuclease SbcC